MEVEKTYNGKFLHCGTQVKSRGVEKLGSLCNSITP